VTNIFHRPLVDEKLNATVKQQAPSFVKMASVESKTENAINHTLCNFIRKNGMQCSRKHSRGILLCYTHKEKTVETTPQMKETMYLKKENVVSKKETKKNDKKTTQPSVTSILVMSQQEQTLVAMSQKEQTPVVKEQTLVVMSQKEQTPVVKGQTLMVKEQTPVAMSQQDQTLVVKEQTLVVKEQTPVVIPKKEQTSKVEKVVKHEVEIIEVDGIPYYVDKQKNIYKHNTIYKINPSIIGKLCKEGEKTVILLTTG